MTDRHTAVCQACGHESAIVYRCERCGHDLAAQGETAGRMDG